MAVQDLAAQISYYRGNAELLQPVKEYAIGAGTGAGARFRGKAGFVSNAVAQAVLGWPAFNYKNKYDFKTNYAGKFVQMDFSSIGIDEISGTLDRANFATKAIASFNPNIRLNLFTELEWLISSIRDEAAAIVQRRVYETPAETMRFTGGNLDYSFTVYKGKNDKREYFLMEAVQSGIKLIGNSIEIGIDENIAPYWRFVDRGHRVVLPGGVEVNSFVQPRPFLEEIKLMAASMLLSWWSTLSQDVTNAERIIFTYIKHGPQGLAKTIPSADFVTALGVASKTFEGIDFSAGIEGV